MLAVPKPKTPAVIERIYDDLLDPETGKGGMSYLVTPRGVNS
jgi:hypothetical protein